MLILHAIHNKNKKERKMRTGLWKKDIVVDREGQRYKKFLSEIEKVKNRHRKLIKEGKYVPSQIFRDVRSIASNYPDEFKVRIDGLRKEYKDILKHQKVISNSN